MPFEVFIIEYNKMMPVFVCPERYVWYNVHESNEQCQYSRRQIGCLHPNLSIAVLIGRMPVNEKAVGFRVRTACMLKGIIPKALCSRNIFPKMEFIKSK